jgi:UDP-N-acetylglucosamine diphosphorylase / glucose-1-phosphate thymidylyltransferase / UDP-N-acetylgalactosamine diphosphorylase / glucosamine-1-phosphate N-acetyltransferase / galactosamine-1-phosphate N-acetyltransferase
MDICIYENPKWQNFLPLVWLKPSFDLRCGMFIFKERIQKIYQQASILTLEKDNSTSLQAELFINGNTILHKPLPDKEAIFIANGRVAGFRTKKIEITNQKLPDIIENLKNKIDTIEIDAQVVEHPWELISLNKETLIKDYELLGKSQPYTVEKGGIVEQGAYLNTDNGPIYVGAGARIRATSLVDGPCYVGTNSLIDGAKIRPAVTIGNTCKIGGEVEESIFSDFSNKHHEGFVGHSYISEWVNLGALTTTSDLKNTYGTIKINTFNSTIDTGTLKLGSFIGDHTKTGIGTLLTTGCVIGCFANIYGGGLFPKYVPPFSWGTKDKLDEYELDKAIGVSKRVMLRRGVSLTQEYELKIKKAFEQTKKERH